jgi:putative drug exporter of the RND superfamily
VIRVLLVPSIMMLMGRWNWWLPSWAARVLRVRPSTA